MLTGLRRYGEAGMFGLWRFLYYQVSYRLSTSTEMRRDETWK